MKTAVSRNTILTAMSSIVVSATSAVYGILILRFYAYRPVVTDAFFVAYSVFMVFAVFSVTLRISIVPMMRDTHTGEVSAGRYRMLTVATLVLSSAVAVLGAVLSIPMGRLLAHGLQREGQLLTGIMLLAFAPVMLCQGMASFLSGVLGSLVRFTFVSVVVILSSVFGIIVFMFSARLGIWSVVLGLFCCNVVYAAAEWTYLRRLGFRVSAADWRGASFSSIMTDGRSVVRCAGPYLAVNVAYLMSQSFTTSLPSGVPTAYAYAFTVISIVVSAICGAMGITLVERYSSLVRESMAEFARSVVSHAAIAGLITAAVLGLVAVLAWPGGLLLFTVLAPPSHDPAICTDMAKSFAASLQALAVGAWGWGVFTVLTSAVVAAAKTRWQASVALALIACHLLLTMTFKKYLGVVGIGVAFSATAVLLALAQALRLSFHFGGRFFGEIVRRGVAVVVVAAMSAALTSAVRRLLEAEIGMIVSSAIATALYCALFAAGSLLFARRTCIAILSHFVKVGS